MNREHRKSSQEQPTLVLGATGRTGRHQAGLVAITETWRIAA